MHRVCTRSARVQRHDQHTHTHIHSYTTPSHPRSSGLAHPPRIHTRSASSASPAGRVQWGMQATRASCRAQDYRLGALRQPQLGTWRARGEASEPGGARTSGRAGRVRRANAIEHERNRTQASASSVTTFPRAPTNRAQRAERPSRVMRACSDSSASYLSPNSLARARATRARGKSRVLQPRSS